MMRKADYILKSSRIYKGTGRKLIDGFVAVKGEKIMFAGPFDQMEGFIGPETKVMDFGDKVIMPGMHDAHIHLYMSGLYSSPLVHASFTDTSEQQCVDGATGLKMTRRLRNILTMTPISSGSLQSESGRCSGQC